MSNQGSETPNEGPTRGIKRKASPDRRSPWKRIRISEGEHPTTSEQSLGQVKRKVRENEEGLLKRKRRRLDILNYGEGSASCSVDIDTESCNVSAEEVKERGLKRKADDDEEGPDRKRRRLEKKKNKIETRLDSSKLRAEFESKYQQLDLLGAGGCGCVFAGYRRTDNLPVAIKHIPQKATLIKHKLNNGKLVPMEVAAMLKLAAATGGEVGASASVSLLDWYDLDQELILVLERPVPCMDLVDYIKGKKGPFSEEEAKIIVKQLIEAAIELHNNNIFHRDIKPGNILIETGLDVPRLRLIDFGLSCFFEEQSTFDTFYGTPTHIPPEFLRRGSHKPGPTTVWQIGVVLFDMLRVKIWFDTNLFLRNIAKINKDLSENCQDFLRKCLAKKPKRRPTLDQLKLHPWLR